MRLRLLTALAVGFAAAAAFAPGGDAGKAKGHRFIGASGQGTGTIWIVDADGNVEWEKKVGECLDVSLLPNGNVFYAARWTTPHRHKEPAVAEVDRHGKVVWEHTVNGEIYSAQRLANGNTLVATADRTIVEFDKDCKEVWKITDADLPADLRPQKGGYRGLCAERLKNGNTVASFEGVFVEFAPDKSIVWRSRSFRGLMGFQLID